MQISTRSWNVLFTAIENTDSGEGIYLKEEIAPAVRFGDGILRFQKRFFTRHIGVMARKTFFILSLAEVISPSIDFLNDRFILL